MPTSWQEFADAAPGLAALGAARFARTGLALVGTLRRDGWPRISPVEPFIVDGQLYLGMMWRSRKALDLLRDSRCVVHSAVSDRGGGEGEFKVYGRAVEVTDPGERGRFADAVYDAIGYRPQEPEFHCFAVAIDSVAFSELRDGEFRRQVWRAGTGDANHP